MFTLSKVRISVTGIAFSDKCKKITSSEILHNHGFYKYLYVYPKNGKHPTMNAFYAKVHRINCETTNLERVVSIGSRESRQCSTNVIGAFQGYTETGMKQKKLFCIISLF